jgi:hypothetical protein
VDSFTLLCTLFPSPGTMGVWCLESPRLPVELLGETDEIDGLALAQHNVRRLINASAGPAGASTCSRRL